jgi:UDP-glucose 4-epimerase
MASAMRGQPITIFGQNGTTRDYIYVSDLASGIVSALERGRVSETYNIGSGIGFSNMDVIESITPLMQKIGYQVRVEHLPERIFDVQANVLDSSKLQNHTGWKPNVDFCEGLTLTRDWLSKCQGFGQSE